MEFRLQIGLDRRQALEEGVDGRVVEPGERAAHDVLAERAEGAERRDRLARKEQAMRAAVGRIGAPLDQPRGVELVDQASERDRRDIERSGELALFVAFAALQARQHGPLGAGRAELAGAQVRLGPEHPRGVVQGEARDLPTARVDLFMSE